MDSGMRTLYPHRLNNRFNLKFPVGYVDQQKSDKSRRAQQLKHCGRNKNEDNSPNENSAVNDNSSSSKSRQKNKAQFSIRSKNKSKK